jgi:hypothetical protein
MWRGAGIGGVSRLVFGTPFFGKALKTNDYCEALARRCSAAQPLPFDLGMSWDGLGHAAILGIFAAYQIALKTNDF